MSKYAFLEVLEEPELGENVWQAVITWPDGRTTHTATVSEERGRSLAEREISERGLHAVVLGQ